MNVLLMQYFSFHQFFKDRNYLDKEWGHYFSVSKQTYNTDLDVHLELTNESLVLSHISSLFTGDGKKGPSGGKLIPFLGLLQYYMSMVCDLCPLSKFIACFPWEKDFIIQLSEMFSLVNRTSHRILHTECAFLDRIIVHSVLAGY